MKKIITLIFLFIIFVNTQAKAEIIPNKIYAVSSQKIEKENIKEGDNITFISLKDCKIIDDMMTKYSYYDHSMADETPLQEFTIDEIEQDIDNLIAWLTDVTSRQNEK